MVVIYTNSFGTSAVENEPVGAILEDSCIIVLESKSAPKLLGRRHVSVTGRSIQSLAKDIKACR